MTSLGAPHVARVLLHCHDGLGPPDKIYQPAVREAVERLLAAEMIEPVEDGHCGDGGVGAVTWWRTTERGALHVEAILEMRFPRRAFVDGDLRVLSVENEE